LTYRITYTPTARLVIAEQLPTVVAAACVRFTG
jgi:hypothetical protein